MRSDGRNPAATDCPCCSKCADSPRFQQLASSSSGLHVYQHVMNHGPTHMITFIFHNTTDNPIKPDHFSDLDPKTVDCPRCRYNLAHAHKLLKEFPQIDRKGIVGVCQQCRPKKEPDNTCKECLMAIQRFKSALDQRVNATNAMNDRKGYLADFKCIKANEINNFKSDAIGAEPRSERKSRIYDFKDLDQSRGPHSDQLHTKYSDSNAKIYKLKKQISRSEVIDRSRDIIKRKEDKNRQKPYKENHSSTERKRNDTEKRKRCIEEKDRKHSGEADDPSYNDNLLRSVKKSSKAKQGMRDKKYTKKDNDDDLNETKIMVQKKNKEKLIKKGTKHQTREESDRRINKNNAIPGKSGKVDRVKKDKVYAAGDITSEERLKKAAKKPSGKKSDRSKSSKNYNSSDEDKEERQKKGNKNRKREKGDGKQLSDIEKKYDSDTNDDERGKNRKGNKDKGTNKQGKEKLRNDHNLTDRFSKNGRKEEKSTVDTNIGKKQKLLGANEVKSKRSSPEQLQTNIAQKDKLIAETLTLAMKAKKDIIFDDSKLEKKQVVPEYKEVFIPKKGKDIKELDIKYTIIPEIIDTGEMTEQKDCEVCAQIDSVVDLFDEANKNMAEEQPEIIIENKIYKYNPLKRSPNFLSIHDIKDKDFADEDTVVLDRDTNESRKHPNTPASKFQRSAGSLPSSDMSHSDQKGVIKYSLSDRSFIDKGWTQMPTEKLVRKMNVYRMRPAHPQSGWFDHYRGKGLMQYPTGEKLAEFDEEGRGRWFYRNGRVALDYYDAEVPSTGRPKTAVTQDNIDAVRQLIKEDRHVTYEQIRASLSIGMTAIQTILHEELGVKKLFSRWVPHRLTEEQKSARVNWCRSALQRFNGGSSNAVYNIVSGDESWIYSYEPERKHQSAVWVFEGEVKPTKVIRSRSVSKKMVASFVSKTSHVATIPLQEQRTVTADWYTTVCLPEVVRELRKTNPNRRIILHHDNASSHTARKTRTFLNMENVELMDHPPYSPDLSPNDYFTFPRIKDMLRGQRFSGPEEAVEAYKSAVLTVSTSDWNYCFNDWFNRMKKCIECHGDYFEKQ
ncbi:unnamed protein product [Plutella xylostella]|uniref:(diamondback moth) hypothetical protein n=1 Tax=Plutella xylostella TaxID=51655 RepID=A0A8S4G074_PLUXY|nr:unnamed protein product [Plutella xylostella]